jgi:hypothetical protein
MQKTVQTKPELYREAAMKRWPVLFAEALGLDPPDEWQKTVLRSNSKRIILNCARQTGKSTVVAVMALQHALYEPNSMVIVISRTYMQAAETFKKIIHFYRYKGRPVSTAITESTHRLELRNGSRIVTLSGQRPESIRGFSGVTLLIVDEAAQVMDEAYFAARPMLAVSGGCVIILSTPHGKRGFFWDTWANKDDWLKVKISADDCSRLTPEFLAEERATFPDWFFLQEYYNHFAEGTSSVFKPEDIDRAFKEGIFVRDEINMDLDDLDEYR